MKKHILNRIPTARRERLLALAPQHTNMTAKRSQMPNANNKVSMGGKVPGSFRSAIDFLRQNEQLIVRHRDAKKNQGKQRQGLGRKDKTHCSALVYTPPRASKAMASKVLKKDRKSVTLRFPFFKVQLSSLFQHMSALRNAQDRWFRLFQQREKSSVIHDVERTSGALQGAAQ